MRILVAAKFILVLHLIFIGAMLLIAGLGADIPFIKYKDLEAHNIPAGIALCVVGLAVAVFWKIQIKERITEKTQTKTEDGSSTTTTRTKTSDVRFMPASKPKE